MSIRERRTTTRQAPRGGAAGRGQAGRKAVKDDHERHYAETARFGRESKRTGPDTSQNKAEKARMSRQKGAAPKKAAPKGGGMRAGGSGRSVRSKREASQAAARRSSTRVNRGLAQSATSRRSAGGQEYTHSGLLHKR